MISCEMQETQTKKVAVLLPKFKCERKTSTYITVADTISLVVEI